MTYPESFLRLVVSGTLNTDEAFSWGLSFADDGSGTDVRFSEVPTEVHTAVRVFHTSAGICSNVAKVATVKLNLIGTDGRYVDQGNTVQYDYPAAQPGASAMIYPPQVALAISLRTAKMRGRAHVGRFYLPSPAAGLDSTGMLTAGSQGAYANAATVLLNALNARLTGYRAAVMSNVGVGDREFITHVAVGRVLDTMRSRRTSLDESYLEGEDLAAV